MQANQRGRLSKQVIWKQPQPVQNLYQAALLVALPQTLQYPAGKDQKMVFRTAGVCISPDRSSVSSCAVACQSTNCGCMGCADCRMWNANEMHNDLPLDNFLCTPKHRKYRKQMRKRPRLLNLFAAMKEEEFWKVECVVLQRWKRAREEAAAKYYHFKMFRKACPTSTFDCPRSFERSCRLLHIRSLLWFLFFSFALHSVTPAYQFSFAEF